MGRPIQYGLGSSGPIYTVRIFGSDPPRARIAYDVVSDAVWITFSVIHFDKVVALLSLSLSLCFCASFSSPLLMASSSLCAYNAPISISSRNYPTSKKNYGESEAKFPLSSSMFSSLNLSSNQNPALHLLSEKRPLRLSSTPRTLTVTAMAPPKPGGKPKKGSDLNL